ncbi:uncharacterized protein RCC_07927 [Ramularia collo-cygni]|uniref:CBM1 domain-containing protein n=1 Tax=Ramularia collo-cygni TaxID=112498 RepID=A0A2D3V2L2_9PEZI|nr:uncharacterized protein RCC_07927 [Ramularia collo-cygni]CZT22058.1 uncharacterized protein RCC_07927 [Ramularia collo-cygni]
MRFVPIIVAASSFAYAGTIQVRGESAAVQYNAYNAYNTPPPPPAPAPAPPAENHGPPAESQAPPPETHAPPPQNHGKVPMYGQCGAGEGKWDGPTECSEGTCHKQQQYYSQCVPEGNSNGGKAQLYQQCGAGEGKWDGPRECSEGTCHKQQQYYEQCVPSNVPLYGQCGAGHGQWNGPTQCAEGSCMATQELYSQCLKEAPPKDNSPPPSPEKETPAPPQQQETPPAMEYTPSSPTTSPPKAQQQYTRRDDTKLRQLFGSFTDNVGTNSYPDTHSRAAPLLPLARAQKFAQCGGADYKGPSGCDSGSTCKYQNEFYSQCVPLST